jgi:hypothetical protein
MRKQTWKGTWSFSFLDLGRLNPIISFHMQRAIENFAKNSHPRMVVEWNNCGSWKAKYTHLQIRE